MRAMLARIAQLRRLILRALRPYPPGPAFFLVGHGQFAGLHCVDTAPCATGLPCVEQDIDGGAVHCGDAQVAIGLPGRLVLAWRSFLGMLVGRAVAAAHAVVAECCPAVPAPALSRAPRQRPL